MLDLDLLSTSQTNPPCIYGAPLVALVIGGLGVIRQSCCNHWDCPCCGQTRARQEYHRIVWGAEVLADDHELYFWTLTCRGKECSLEESEENYYAWTNVLLTNARTKAKRAEQFWAYVQVTERQHKTRHHPHSHILTTFCPSDAKVTSDNRGAHHLVSQWFMRANTRAQLGTQCVISEVENAAAVSRYVAKYMFKDSMTEKWPPKWKRVRYSENWPKPPFRRPEVSITLLKPADWQEADKLRVPFVAETVEVADRCKHHMANVVQPMPWIAF